MRDLVEQPRGKPPAPPSFSRLEPALRELAAAREAAALSDEPSAELLRTLDRAIEIHGQNKATFDQALAPIPKAGAVAYLGLLLQAFPNGGVQQASAFGQFMREDVMSLDPSFGAVEMACRRWRQKSKFLPAIAEMMVEVRAARDELAGIAEFVDRLPAIRNSLAARLSR
ncbi:threonine dehydrogenase-like Zn-dependent dehydrogenase [Bradyrhizobium sp. USDA 4503]